MSHVTPFRWYRSGGYAIPAKFVRPGDVVLHKGVPKTVDRFYQEGWARFVGVRVCFLDGTETYLEAHQFARTCIPGVL